MSNNAGILFADLSGTTRLSRKIGSDEARHQLERCIKRMERAIESTKGQLVMPAGDEMMARFPSAEAAILAAVEMQRRIQDLPPLSGVRLSIRIGVHFGPLEESSDGPAGAGIDIGRALLKLAGAGQVVTCATTAAVLPRALQENLYSIEGMLLPLPDGGEAQVYLFGWQGEPARPAHPAVPEAAPAAAPERHRMPSQLALRWESRAFLVDADTPRLQIGRDRDCDLRLAGVKVSRKHARIEYRPTGFFLVDESSNGTYLYVEGVGESRVHGEEAALQGRGRIGFGHPTGRDDGEVIQFELS